ncbi:glucose 1-dehydrogenase [uncultured Cohaesibacter sp.]|uniref:SDR family NAD(P)-dependent oxidoreductase n=1 Tax=uncultured Cohaesibacter sp. TaxID=1002546 RepID=UPI0029C8B8BA|nr:glucose 1-dehydrogenase [uncultured Cohaesibacter sp.]
MRLKGKRAIVTGSSHGIGESIIEEMIVQGARVILNTSRPSGLDALKAKADALNKKAGEDVASAICASVDDEDQVKRLVRDGSAWLGGLDIFINNAGVESTISALDLDMAEWDRVMNVNLKGAFMCAREAARIMIDQGTGGVILGNSSIHEAVTRMGLTHYTISKAGMRMMHKALALEWAEYNIRVLGVAPGAIETDMNREEIAAFGKDKFEEWIPLSRLGQCGDVAKTVAFLVSDDASYITGTTLEIDGGYVLNLVRYDPREG